MALLTALMPSSFRQRIDQWIARRNPPSQGKINLHNRRLYILPTRFGYLYAFMLLVLLLAAINYQNSMAFALTFLLAAIGQVSLWQTHKNLHAINIDLKAPEPVFCGEKLTLNFKLNNEHQRTRYAVGIQYQLLNPQYTGIKPEANAHIELEIPTNKRGQYSLSGFTIFTRYPTGLFHAWSVLKYDQQILIYPEPHFDRPLKQTVMDAHSGKSTVDTADGDDFAGLREHRNGESLRHISWKAYAQGRGMLTKTFQGHGTPSIWINWLDMSAKSIEGKLSEMTGLIIQAHQQGQKYGMKLPGATIEQDTGTNHRANCLQQLATYHQSNINSELTIDAA